MLHTCNMYANTMQTQPARHAACSHLDALLTSCASDTSVNSNHSINPTPASSVYSNSNRSSISEGSQNILLSMVSNPGSSMNNPAQQLWLSSASQDSLSNTTFTNWNFNSVNKPIDRPGVLSNPTSPLPPKFPLPLRGATNQNKSLQFSLNDPFLPASLKNESDVDSCSGLYQINSSENLYRSLSNQLFNSANSNNLNNDSLLNNQFLNKNYHNKKALFNLTDESQYNYNSFSSNSSNMGDELNGVSFYESYTLNPNPNLLPDADKQMGSPPNYDSPKQLANANNLNALNKVNKTLFKTELCDSFVKLGYCPYNEKCQFAHGYDELKSPSRPKKWKTKMCKNWIEKGHCRYGKRCCYKHGENDDGSDVHNQLSPIAVLKH